MGVITNSFQKWFTTFLEEKQVDMSEFTGHHNVQIGDVCQKIMNTTPAEQKCIKTIIVKIDFENGNINNFFNHLAKPISVEELEKQRQEMME